MKAAAISTSARMKHDYKTLRLRLASPVVFHFLLAVLDVILPHVVLRPVAMDSDEVLNLSLAPTIDQSMVKDTLNFSLSFIVNDVSWWRWWSPSICVILLQQRNVKHIMNTQSRWQLQSVSYRTNTFKHFQWSHKYRPQLGQCQQASDSDLR